MTPGGTTFVNEESFTGALSFMMGDNIVARPLGMHAKTTHGFEKYNADLKVWCESSNAGK